MADSADVFVRIGADLEPLKKGFKTAKDQMKDFKDSAMDSAKVLAGIATAAAAAASAAVLMASKSAESAREIKNLAAVAGMGTKEFQNYAYASKQFGIEQDKLADIFKDTNDKIGDFIQTGAGPLVDFFDNIAPKVGVTAEEFAMLSGPQALGKYVAALEQAGVSQNEMTFYLEAIASDATLLLPLLKDNGAAFSALAKDADKLNLALSDADISQLNSMQVALDDIKAVAKSATDQFSVELAPIIKEIAKGFKDAAVESGGFKDKSKSAIDAIAASVGFLGNAWRGFQVIIKGVEVAFQSLSYGANVVLTSIVVSLDEARQGFITAINSMIEAVNLLPGVDISKMVVGQSALAESMSIGLEAAKEEWMASLGELNALMLAPLPSEMVEARLESIRANAAAEVAIESQKLADIKEKEAASNAKRLADSQSFGAKWRRFNESFRKEDKQGAQNFFGDLATLTSSGNRRLFEIGKIAAASNVVIDTNEAAMKAYNWAAKWGGPVAGGVAAGAAILAGGVRLAAINSTSFGGGGSVGGGSSAGASSTAQAASAAPQQQQPEQQRTIRLESLDPNALVSGSMINTLAQNLVDLQKDGFKLVI